MSSLVHENLALAPPLAPILRKRAPPDAELRSAAAGAPPGLRTSTAAIGEVHLGQTQPSFFPDGILNGIEEPEAAKDDEDKMDDADDDAASQASVTSVHLGQNQPSFFPDGILNGIEEPEAAKDDEDKKDEKDDDADDDAGSQMSGTSMFGDTRHEYDELIAELEGASPASPASPVSAGSRMSPTSPLPWTSNLAPVDTTPWDQLEGVMSFPFSV